MASAPPEAVAAVEEKPTVPDPVPAAATAATDQHSVGTPAVESASPPDQVPESPAEKLEAVTSAAPAALAIDLEAPPDTGGPPMIEIWWPKDTGPFRRQTRPKDRGAKERPAKHRPKPMDARQPKPPARPPRREPPPNPDSPFAVLGELRAQLATKKNG
jgi:hypothetical protein